MTAIQVFPPGSNVDYGSNVAPPPVVSSATGTLLKLFAATASTTVANTTTETTLFASGAGSLTIPANYLAAGSTLRMTMRGIIAGTATPTVRLKAKIGGNLIVDTGALASALGAQAGFSIQCDITCRTAGGTGTAIGNLTAFAAPLTFDVNSQTTATTTIDTTAANAFDFTFQWGAASASNTVTISTATLEYAS